MKHRFRNADIGTYCFRCGVFRHALDGENCDARHFPGVEEHDLQEAEDWVAKPHTEERNYLAVKAYLAGKTRWRDEN